MRFLGITSLGLFIDIMREVGYKSTLSIYYIKKWFYENALHIGNTPCKLEWFQKGFVLQFYDKGKILLEVVFNYAERE